MAQPADPLASLLTSDAQTIDRKKLAELLKPYVVIDKESKEIVLTPEFHSIEGNDLRVEVLLAGAKARSLLFGEADGMLPAELIATGILAEGSTKSSLKRLFDNKKTRKDKNGRHYIPTHLLSALAKRLAT